MKLFNWLRWLFRRDHGTSTDNIGEYMEWLENLRLERRISSLSTEIARLKRNKKKHSHLQKELDALIDKGADKQP